MGDCKVDASISVRNLGVIFDDTMSMKPQVNSIIRQTNYQLRSIGRIRNFLNFDACSSVIHASISSRLDYCNSLLFGLPDNQIKRLQKVQNTAARILTRTGKYDHISHALKTLHWLPVNKRIEYKIHLLTYKCLNGEAPEYLAELLTLYQPTRTLRSADRQMLTVPKTRLKTYGDRAFAKSAPMLWNALPIDVKSASSLSAFKSALKRHLFNVAYNE